jgi:hypothetical protein
LHFDEAHNAAIVRNAITEIVLALCVVQVAPCCSLRSMVLQRVTPDISVTVTHNKGPIAGIEVQVERKNETNATFRSVTDERGVVTIRGLEPGEYYLSASHLDFEAGKEWIEVVTAPDAKTKKHFDFEWESDFQTRRLAGRLTGLIPGNTGNKLMDIIHPSETVYPGVSITLRNAFGSEEFATISDSTGGFVLDHVPDGIYVLIISGGMKAISGIADVTRVVIDLSQKSDRVFLPLRLRDTGCYQTLFGIQESS